MSLRLDTALRQYVVEHAKPERCDLKRIGYAQDRLIEFFGAERDVETIKRSDIRAYRAHRLGMGVTDSTVRRELVVLRAALEHAAEEERIQAVPAIKLPPESPPRQRWFTEEEATKIMEQPMSERARLFLYMGFGTGARKTAIVTVPVGRVDLAKGLIDFRDPEMKVTKKKRVQTKIVEWLASHVAAACKGKKPTDYLLGGSPESPLPDIGPEIKRIFKSAGVDEKGVRCHALRRTFVIWSFQAGAKPIEVSAATGDSMATLERSYVTINATQAGGAVSRIQNPEGSTNGK